MAEWLKGGTPRGYLVRAEMVPAAPTATRRTGRIDETGALWHGDRTDAHIVFVAPYSNAHREFRRWCDRNGMKFRAVGTGAKLHDAADETEVSHANDRFDRETGTDRAFRPDGRRRLNRIGNAAVTLWPVAYQVVGPVALAELLTLTFTHPAPNQPREPVVERAHVESVLTPMGPGSGQGELSESAARRLKADKRERGYRAAERAKGTLRENMDAPPLTERQTAPDAAALTHNPDGSVNELGAQLAQHGARIIKVRECFDRPGFAWVSFHYPREGKTLRKLLALPAAPVAPTARPAADRRADELATLGLYPIPTTAE